jgi:hypothetical protein
LLAKGHAREKKDATGYRRRWLADLPVLRKYGFALQSGASALAAWMQILASKAREVGHQTVDVKVDRHAHSRFALPLCIGS